MIQTGVRLPEDVHAYVQAESQRSGLSISKVVAHIITAAMRLGWTITVEAHVEASE